MIIIIIIIIIISRINNPYPAGPAPDPVDLLDGVRVVPPSASTPTLV